MAIDLYMQPEIMITFFYVFLRLSGFFFLFPIFTRPLCPAPVSIFLALLCALLLLPNALEAAEVAVGETTGMAFILPAARELLLGLAVGFCSMMVLVLGQVAGQFLDFQMGFFTATEIDPVMGTRVPLVGNYLYLFSLVLFLTFNGHHYLLKALGDSFTVVPVGSSFSRAAIPPILTFMSWMFKCAFQVSLPVLAALLVASAALGILARSMPQLNLFVLGIPIRIIIGATMLMVMTTLYASYFRDVTARQIGDITQLLRVW